LVTAREAGGVVFAKAANLQALVVDSVSCPNHRIGPDLIGKTDARAIRLLEGILITVRSRPARAGAEEFIGSGKVARRGIASVGFMNDCCP